MKTHVYAVLRLDKEGKESLMAKYSSNPYYLRRGDATKAAAKYNKMYGFTGSRYLVVESALDWRVGVNA